MEIYFSKVFLISICPYFFLWPPLFIKARYIEWTVNWPCWYRFHLIASSSLSCIHTMLNTNSYHILILLLFKVLRKEMFRGLVLRTESTISLFLLTILYNDGYLSQSDVFLIHKCSQNLIRTLSLNLDSNLRKLSFTFIKPDQKCESPYFLTTLPIVSFFTYLFLKFVCHVPYSFISMNNNLLSKHWFWILMFCIPIPPWSLGWQIILHFANLYFFFWLSLCKKNLDL
jgi:hypothetical protein